MNISKIIEEIITPEHNNEIINRQIQSVEAWIKRNFNGAKTEKYTLLTMLSWKAANAEALASKLNEFSCSQVSWIKFKAEGNNKIFAVWSPYYWEDENWGRHPLKNISYLNNVIQKYEVFDVGTVDGELLTNLYEEFSEAELQEEFEGIAPEDL